MAARTGDGYLKGLRDARQVWLNGERVDDVTRHPALSAAARSVALLFDLQHTAADVCLATNPATGEPMNVSHLIPRSQSDLLRRHACIERMALESVGLLGRSPDYLNVTLAGFAGRSDVWKMNDNDEGAANLVAFQQECAARDLALTHTIVNTTIDKSVPEVQAANGEAALHKVENTSSGIRVRGSRALATLAPFADELFVYPGQPIPKDAAPYALAFSIPIETPGIIVLCRDSYSVGAGSFDHPFSSRFDEQDAVVIFDDVEVPRARVFLDGDPAIYNRVMTTGWIANVMQQTTIRALTKLEFAYELATRMVEVVNGGNPATFEQLGEIWSYAELTRSALRAAECDAHEWGNGVWFCDERPFRALRPSLPRWFPRVNEIIKLLGAHNLLATPTAAELANPQLRPLLDRYYAGVGGCDARERTRIFRAAWDLVGSALGGRNELYERFYLASASRSYQIAHAAAQAEQRGRASLLDGVLGDAADLC
jgi:4-hydroxyphenylacetate 3-monooxygenase